MADCLFCRIVSGELPAERVYEDADVVAFRDINPAAPVHVLVVPRRHVATLTDAGDGEVDLLGRVLAAAAKVAGQEGLSERGFRSVINTGPDAQQSVQHVHVHVLGGRSMTWPPG
ncbi:MAG TPA: histidine triad nucleotide-binding protein [Chloroflexota bacterium]|nr:histidine triad nucleotide-binding protein [Chloroflexota bacterium]